MKLSGTWDDHHKLIGDIKFILFNKPFKKVRDYGHYQPMHMVQSGHFMEKSA